MDKSDLYKVVLVFNLQDGKADEELKRSKEENSFPDLLSKQPGFVELELIKINDQKTMSIQTWETENDWWMALETARKINENARNNSAGENILISRGFLNGYIQVHTRKK
jgi:heme-degrading monooxygenase HmoA